MRKADKIGIKTRRLIHSGATESLVDEYPAVLELPTALTVPQQVQKMHLITVSKRREYKILLERNMPLREIEAERLELMELAESSEIPPVNRHCSWCSFRHDAEGRQCNEVCDLVTLCGWIEAT